MMMLLVSLLFIVLASDLSNGVHFNYTTPVMCLNQPVEYQCTVTGPAVTNVLTWRVFTDSTQTTQFDSAVVYTSNVIQASTAIGGVFTVEQLSKSPLISNISFTVQSSINGYTIICEDSIVVENVTLIISVPGNIPDNVTIHTSTFTNSSVNISLTASSSPCVTGYRYNISSSALEENIIMESTSNSVMVEGLVPSDDQYCVVVATLELYSTQTTKEYCFLFNVPLPVTTLSVKATSVSSSTAHLVINWNHPAIMTNSSDIAVPDLIGYHVTISSDNYTSQSELLSPNTMNHTFTAVPVGHNYTVIVIAVNGVGDSVSSILYNLQSSTSTFTVIPTTFHTTTQSVFVDSITMYSHSTRSFSSSSSTRITSCASPTCTMVSSNIISDTGNIAVIIGGSVGGAIGLVALSLLILLTVLMVFIAVKFIRSGSHTLNMKQNYAYELQDKETCINLTPQLMDDKIWKAGERGDDVVDKCIQKLQELVRDGVFPDDKGLMRRIAYVMTINGTCNQPNIHFDGGIWQVSRYAFQDSQAIDDHSRLRHKYHKISKALPQAKDWMDIVPTDLEIPMYSMLAARLYLSNFPDPIPMEKEVKEQQDYWWRLYMKEHEGKQFMSKTCFEEADLDRRIWVAGEKGDDVVDRCIKKLQELVHAEVFPDDHGFLRRIAYVMTKNGCDRLNIHNDGGIWQVSLYAFKDSQAIHDHNSLKDKYSKISKALGIKDWMEVMTADREIPMYSMLAARLYLNNFPDPIPMEEDIKEQQDYWWRFYMKEHEGRRFMNKTHFEKPTHEIISLNEKIWVAGEKGADVVDECIEKLNKLVEKKVFPDDKGLMKRIAYAMTRNGTSNIRNDGGIWQVSRHAFEDSQAVDDHSRLKGKHQIIKDALGIDWVDVQKTDMKKPIYSMLAARLYLSNSPQTIPMENDIIGQQDYWWRLYMKEHEGKQFMSKTCFEEADLDQRIWVAGEKGDDVVDRCIKTLQELVRAEVFPDDHGLLRRIAYVMTKNGCCDWSNIHNDGGIWQVSLRAFKDTQTVDNHQMLKYKHEMIRDVMGINWIDVTKADMERPIYSMLAARLYLSNFPDPIPMENDIEGQQAYWWKFYMMKHEALKSMSESYFKQALQ